LTEGVFARHGFWWTLEDKYPLAKTIRRRVQKKSATGPSGAPKNSYMQFAIWARMVSEAGSFYPPERNQAI